jgi:hypothetical protein
VRVRVEGRSVTGRARPAARGPVRRAFDASVRETDRDKRDRASVVLGQLYADQLDAAAELAGAALDLARALARQDEPAEAAHARKLAGALDARQAAADLGPKFLAVLAALNMTTAARSAVSGKDGAREQPDPAELALLAHREQARQQRPAAVDSPAPPAHP